MVGVHMHVSFCWLCSQLAFGLFVSTERTSGRRLFSCLNAMVWPLAVRVRTVEQRWQLGSTVRACRALSRERGAGPQPSAETIRSGWRLSEGRAHARRPQRLTQTVLRTLRCALQRNPRPSVLRLSARTGVPRSSVQRAIRQQLRLFPDKLQLVQRHQGAFNER